MAPPKGKLDYFSSEGQNKWFRFSNIRESIYYGRRILYCNDNNEFEN